MAFINKTRVGNTHQKKSRCAMVAVAKDLDIAAGGNFLIGYLPPDAMVTDALVFTKTAGAANTVTVGTTEGGTEILSAGDAAAAGASGTFTGESDTGSGVPVYMATTAAVDGDFIVNIEYTEYLLNTGEMTLID